MIITLTFNVKDWKMARYAIDCFRGCARIAYAEDSPNRVEIENIAEDLTKQAKRQVKEMGEDYDT